MKKQINALDLLQEITEQRGWHQHIMARNTASELKKRLKEGKVSYKKAVAILEELGHQKVKEEVWEIKK